MVVLPVAGSTERIQRSLLSAERALTTARVPSSDQTGGWNNCTGRSRVVSSLVRSLITFIVWPGSIVLASPVATFNSAKRVRAWLSPTRLRDGMSSV